MKLAVLFGGISSEHDISCLSAASILRNLNKDKYEIYPVGITRDGEWFYCPDCDPDRVESGAWERMTGKVKVVLAPDRGMHGMVLLREGEIEIVVWTAYSRCCTASAARTARCRVCSNWPAFRTSAAA